MFLNNLASPWNRSGVLVACAATVCAIVTSGLTAYLNSRAQERAAQQVIHSQQILATLNQVETAMIDAETGQRGFLLTGDKRFLEPYWSVVGNGTVPAITRPSITRLLAAVTQQAGSNPVEKQLLKKMEFLVDSKLQELKRTIDLRLSGKTEEAMAIVVGGRGKELMDALRMSLSSMRAEESRLQAKSEGQRLATSRRSLASAALVSLLSLTTLVVLIGTTTLASRRLRKREEQYRLLFESIDEGFCIVQMMFDRNGAPCDYRFCEINPMFERQTGLVDALGKTMRGLEPRHEQHWFDMYGRVALTGEPIRFQQEAKALNRYYDVYAFRTGEPSKHRVAILFRDVSAQRRVELALRESERLAIDAAHRAEAERRRLDAVLEAIPVGLIVTDVNGRILLANAAHRQLWGERHPLAQSLEESGKWKGWWADGSPHQGRRLEPGEWTTARVLRGQDAARDIIEIESFDTPPIRRICLNSGAAIRDGRGRILGAVVAQLDITDQLKAEHALRQADRRKDEFLAMLAHELRNPLAPIAAAADLLSLAPMDQDRIKQISIVIARQVRHMTDLVNDLLDVSRVTRGLVSIKREELDAKRVVADAIEQVRPLIDARGQRLRVDLPAALALVEGDQKRLVQVIANLLNNAAKYTPEGGSITLQMEVDDTQVRMRVTDDGIGMDADLLNRAFDLFSQAAQTSDRSQGGLGIGLALVKSLLELHGGSVTASSSGPGKGSSFTVSLPRLQPRRVLADRAEQDAASEAVRGCGMSIMVVDDNMDAARVLALLLESWGYRVEVAYGAVEALKRAKTGMPKVFLLDVGLPNMDGYELAVQLRAQSQNAELFLIAITGYGQEQDQRKAFAAGFDYHFVKPVDSKRLARVLNAIGARG